jgi:hypothetical protein
MEMFMSAVGTEHMIGGVTFGSDSSMARMDDMY